MSTTVSDSVDFCSGKMQCSRRYFGLRTDECRPRGIGDAWLNVIPEVKVGNKLLAIVSIVSGQHSSCRSIPAVSPYWRYGQSRHNVFGRLPVRPNYSGNTGGIHIKRLKKYEGPLYLTKMLILDPTYTTQNAGKNHQERRKKREKTISYLYSVVSYSPVFTTSCAMVRSIISGFCGIGFLSFVVRCLSEGKTAKAGVLGIAGLIFAFQDAFGLLLGWDAYRIWVGGH